MQDDPRDPNELPEESSNIRATNFLNRHFNTNRKLVFGLFSLLLVLGIAVLIISSSISEKKIPGENTQTITEQGNPPPVLEYIEKDCDAGGTSNMEWKECEKDNLEKIKIEKAQAFKRVQDMFKENSQNILVDDDKSMKEFLDWYKNSDANNKSRCLANVYWTMAGSAYEGNLASCQAEETLRDIELLNELYENSDYFKEWPVDN